MVVKDIPNDISSLEYLYFKPSEKLVKIITQQ